MRQSSDVDALNEQMVAALDGLPALSEVPVNDVRTAREEGRSGDHRISSHSQG